MSLAPRDRTLEDQHRAVILPFLNEVANQDMARNGCFWTSLKALWARETANETPTGHLWRAGRYGKRSDG
jgi:hypothetical protein